MGTPATVPFRINHIASSAGYQSYLLSAAEVYEERFAYERSLIRTNDPFTVPGYCFVCERASDFHVDFRYAYQVKGILTPNWREHLICDGCGLNNRMRAAVQIFQQECAPGALQSIYCTEQTTALYRVLRHRFPGVTGSEYLGKTIEFGAIRQDGIRNESIASLTFPDCSFDHILSFDVFEHVPDFRKGFQECFRVLKPGGALFFTIPFTRGEKTIVRAKISPNGSVVHLLPPEYHGDPLSSAGCLCYYHFGWELLDDLAGVGFVKTEALLYWSKDLGYLGNGDQIIFMARKG
jgi:SAM-dependent methyltransferase